MKYQTIIQSIKINQHDSRKEQLESKASFLNERMKLIKCNLDETWKSTTSFQYGTVVHVASLKKYSESVDDHQKDISMIDQEFQSIGERLNQLNAQFSEFGSSMSSEEKKKSELSKALKSSLQSRNSLDKVIEAGNQRLIDMEKTLSEMNINLSVTLNELQNKETLLQNTTFEKKQMEESEATLGTELSGLCSQIEELKACHQLSTSSLDGSKKEEQHLVVQLEERGVQVFNEVSSTVEMDIDKINQEVELCKAIITTSQEEFKFYDSLIIERK